MADMLAVLRDLRDNGYLPIDGPECPSCGRDNSRHGNVCTSDDCPAVRARTAIREAEEPKP